MPVTVAGVELESVAESNLNLKFKASSSRDSERLRVRGSRLAGVGSVAESIRFSVFRSRSGWARVGRGRKCHESTRRAGSQ
jgi:hypothetical protein